MKRRGQTCVEVLQQDADAGTMNRTKTGGLLPQGWQRHEHEDDADVDVAVSSREFAGRQGMRAAGAA
eukprot:2852408-Karenia_brevis.AAC.1